MIDFLLEINKWQVFLIIILVIVLVVSLVFNPYREQIDATYTCIDNGYPEMLKSGNELYCHKVENGTDIIVPVSNFESLP